MSIQKVREYFKQFGIEDRIREFDVSSATVELAAVAVGVEGARIAKSMSFKVGEEPIIIVVAGDAKVDNSRYKAQFHTKAKMLTFEEAHTMIGHDPGGVCSFALPDNVKTYLDISLKRFETVFPAAGSSNSAIELTCEELEKYSSLRAFIREVAVPEMQIKLRQGFGRAIRTESDTCVIAILDERACRGRRYAQAVSEALPEMRRTGSLREVTRFLREKKPESYFEVGR